MSNIDSAIGVVNSFISSDPNSVAGSVGLSSAQAALHMTYPNDFEYYMMALELTTYDGRTIDYFVFPVNPSSYNQDEPSATNIRKTMGGVSAVGNSSFMPIDIRIAGNFGRKFKVLVGKGTDTPDVSVAQYSTESGTFNKEGFVQNLSGKFSKQIMDSKVKTGYGAIKILQAICDKSRGDINGKPNQLYLYNPAFNANFLVKVISFAPSMAVQNNFIWGYELTMKAIAPLEVIVGKDALNKSLSNTMNRSIIQGGANKVLRNIINVVDNPQR